MYAIRSYYGLYFRTVTLPILFDVEKGGEGMQEALEALYAEVDRIIENDEANVVILSDRGMDKDHAPIPSRNNFV